MPKEDGDERKNNGSKGKAVRNDGGNGSIVVVDDSASVCLLSTAAAIGEGGGPNSGSLLDEVLAALQGERCGISPVVLVPAAARVAHYAGVLTAAAATPFPTANSIRTMMDPVLSAQ